MLFWVEITNMPLRMNVLFKVGLLIDEIGLQKEESAAAAVVHVRVTFSVAAVRLCSLTVRLRAPSRIFDSTPALEWLRAG